MAINIDAWTINQNWYTKYREMYIFIGYNQKILRYEFELLENSEIFLSFFNYNNFYYNLREK